MFIRASLCLPHRVIVLERGREIVTIGGIGIVRGDGWDAIMFVKSHDGWP